MEGSVLQKQAEEEGVVFFIVFNSSAIFAIAYTTAAGAQTDEHHSHKNRFHGRIER